MNKIFIYLTQIYVIEDSPKYMLLTWILRVENVLKKYVIAVLSILYLTGLFILVIGHSTAKLKKVAIVWFFILLPLLYIGAIYALAGIYTAILIYMK